MTGRQLDHVEADGLIRWHRENRKEIGETLPSWLGWTPEETRAYLDSRVLPYQEAASA